jgi:hypothetical protein
VIEAGTAGSSAAAGSSGALLDGFQPGIVVSVVIAAIGAVVTFAPLLGRLRNAGRVAVATGSESDRSG